MVKSTSPDEKPWAIERIVSGDDMRSPSGIKLHMERFYGSAVSHGGHETFWEIDVDTVSLSTRGASRICYKIKAATAMARLKGAPTKELEIPIRKSASRQRRQRALLKSVKDFCSKNPGFAVLLGGPGDRQARKDTSGFSDASAGEVFMRAKDGECLAAAITNAVFTLEGRALAEEAQRLLTGRSSHYRSVASCGRAMHKLSRKFDLRKVPKSHMEGFKKNKFEWLGNLDWGVWIVRLVKPRILDHCVVVDGIRKLVIDSAEKHPLVLSSEVLRLCGGGEGENLHVAEAREVRLAGDAKKV